MTARAERLLLLAMTLEGIPEDQFTIGWEIPIVPTVKTRRGCALGWAAQIPALVKQGLAITKSPEGFPMLGFEGASGMEAAQKFFDLDVSEAWTVFTPDGYQQVKPTPRIVAARLRQYAGKPKPKVQP